MHSFTRAGVTITDHHTESVRFLKHLEIEERSGRACPADWTWIVPPAAASTTPVFHRYYANFDASPNFYRHGDDSGGNDVATRSRLARGVVPQVSCGAGTRTTTG